MSNNVEMVFADMKFEKRLAKLAAMKEEAKATGKTFSEFAFAVSKQSGVRK